MTRKARRGEMWVQAVRRWWAIGLPGWFDGGVYCPAMDCSKPPVDGCCPGDHCYGAQDECWAHFRTWLDAGGPIRGEDEVGDEKEITCLPPL